MRLLPQDVAVAAAAEFQQGVRRVVLPYFGGAELKVHRVLQRQLDAVSHAVLESSLAAVPEEASGLFERTKFNIDFRVAAAVRLVSDASMRGPRDFLFEGDFRQLGELRFLEGLFGGGLMLVGFHVGRHLDPGDLALDDLGGLALLALGGPQLQALRLAGVGPAGAQQILLGLGEAHPLVGRGVTLAAVPDRHADSLPPGCGGVTVDGLDAQLLLLRALRGRQALLILELV